MSAATGHLAAQHAPDRSKLPVKHFCAITSYWMCQSIMSHQRFLSEYSMKETQRTLADLE